MSNWLKREPWLILTTVVGLVLMGGVAYWAIRDGHWELTFAESGFLDRSVFLLVFTKIVLQHIMRHG